MNVLISVDMEGIAGVVAEGHTSATTKDYERFRKLMTAEANAAIDGAIDGGANQIVVNDSHGPMTNILIEELNPIAQLITGNPKPSDMMQGIGTDVDAVFFIGYHGATGTAKAVLDHSWSLRATEVRLNDKIVGETGINAAIAGAYNVPVVLVTGDAAVTEEARTLLGKIETVTVKDGISRTAAKSLHPGTACELIRKAAERSLKLTIDPFVIAPPITVRITFQRTIHADMAELVPNSNRINGTTIEWTGQDMDKTFQAFQAMGLLATIS